MTARCLPDLADSISISKAANLAGVSARSIKRWGLDGVALRTGGRVKLRLIRMPSGFRTTEAWLSEFIDALTRDRTGQNTAPAAVEERATRADRVLAASGW